MPIIRNLKNQLVNLKRIGSEIEAKAEKEITDEEAALLAGHPALEFLDKTPTKTTNQKGEQQ